MILRYSMVGLIAREFKPDVAIEIGCHRGNTSKLIAPHCKMFYGFDLWEEGNADNDKLEDNGKGRSSKSQVEHVLSGRKFELIQGNTRLTLPEFAKRGVKVNFAFIDGGHSVDTIRSDWDSVKRIMAPGGVVVFDDYYVPQHEKWGCNTVVDAYNPELMPPDPHPYGRVHLAVISL